MKFLDIPVQKLFIIALVLKVLFSALGWLLESPWLLGFVVPLIIMSAYIWLGLIRRETNVSDEKFADSAYYLGFIFTITSIIFSLFDLPNIGTKIQDISVRFGAAMVSTVLGLGVRVYLVTFREDFSDAIERAEDALLRSTQVFTERLKMSLERLQDFESSVDLASRTSVERVNLQIEAMSRNHAENLAEFFAELTSRNQQLFVNALDEVKAASTKLAESVDGYATGMKTHITSIEQRVLEFASAITLRLQKTTFPDDYFAVHLKQPLAQIVEAAGDVAKTVTNASAAMAKTTKSLTASLKSVNDKSSKAEESMDSIIRLAEQQKIILESAQGQLNSLGQLGLKLIALDDLLLETVASLQSSHAVNTTLAIEVGKMISESSQNRENYLKNVNSLNDQLEKNASSSDALRSSISTAVVTSEGIVQKLEEYSTAHLSASSSVVSALDERVDQALSKISETVSGLQEILRTVNLLVVNSHDNGIPVGITPVQLAPFETIERDVKPLGSSISPLQTNAIPVPSDIFNKQGST